LVDCDPIRPSNVSATDAEKAAALEVARRNVSIPLRHLRIEISVVWTRFASRFF
jgi:hypothetical protein